MQQTVLENNSVVCFGRVGQSVTPPPIPDPLSLLRAALAEGKVVAWLATSPLSSEIRTPLSSQSPGTEGGEAAGMEGQTGVGGWTRGERGDSRGNKVGGERDEEAGLREGRILCSPQLLEVKDVSMSLVLTCSESGSVH